MINEIKDLLECISKFDETETLTNKGKYFSVIQKDAKEILLRFNIYYNIYYGKKASEPHTVNAIIDLHENTCCVDGDDDANIVIK